jgi:glycosyltransferase involved in cell wall biosynthesis
MYERTIAIERETESTPTVTVALPVLDEEEHLEAALDSIADQSYPFIMEVLVVDGGSSDRTREIARTYPRLAVRVLDNPRRIQAAALNVALRQARGEVFLRVDGHCVLETDYVECCVRALVDSGAALVGGGMTPDATGVVQRGIAKAMASRFGAGPARFHTGGPSGWVDTVYLGAFRTDLARLVGGYAEDVGVNEDAELAIRLGRVGGVWYDPEIRSHYVPRGDVRSVARQFYGYGRSRALTVRHHPETLRLRQLLPPLLVLGLASPWRRRVATVYGAGIAARTVLELARDPRSAPGFAATLPAMHLSWGSGFLAGLVYQKTRPPSWCSRASLP